MANGDRSMTQTPGCMVRMAQYRFSGTHVRAGVWRFARAAALTLVLLVAGQPPPAAPHAAAAGAGTSAAGLHLYWANDGIGGVTVGRAGLDGTHVNNKFVVGGVDPERLCGVAIAGKYLYWGIDVSSGSPLVGRAKLDGTGVNQAFISSSMSAGPVCGVAVAGGVIYWASYNSEAIGQASLDGSFVNEHFISGLAGIGGGYGCGSCDPDGVAVAGGYIYWGGVHAIGRAKFDGTGVDEQFITGIYFPVAVAVTNKYIYWTDQGGNFIGGPNHPSMIGRARLDGTAVQRSFIKGLGSACGLAVTDRYIYWGEFGTFVSDSEFGAGGALGRANLDGTGVRTHFISGLNGTCGVAVGP